MSIIFNKQLKTQKKIRKNPENRQIKNSKTHYED